jgi:hypothetical protein
MIRFNLFLFAIVCCVGFVSNLCAQGKIYEGPDDPAGDIAAEREGYMTGNRVYLYFQNTSELADWPRVDASLWPNTYDGTRTLDGIGLLVGARVYIKNDTIPVDKWDDIRSTPNLDTLYYCQTSYRQGMDTDPTGTLEWGFYPPFGYINENSEYPAMSNRPNSWPVNGWPASGEQLKWPGEWDGRFGRGIIYADLETYFVVNDAHDQEYLGFEDRIKYYPRPGVNIGDKRPDVTIQKGKPWGGLGIRVEQRGFQWNNHQARDAIFWEYSIANISDYDLPEVAFGYWVDTWIGGEGASDDVGFFDVYVDMAYSWDTDGLGFGGRTPGTLGFAYLESPGIPYDTEDNDDDGLLNEKRDNPATRIVGPTEDIDDVSKFLEFYKLSLEDLRDHWDADEDQDWDDGFDANGNGVYDLGEDPGDDVGLDGVGPGELNYFGPDFGECNHKPDYEQGVGSEPDFNATDVSESDMVGLTSFRLFNIPNENACYQWFCGDQSMWDLIGREALIEWSGNLSNLIMTFASGPFPLFKGREERISMSELHSYDPLAGLNSPDHSAPALYEQKRIVQIIYEKDYRFAQPPRMPTLSATAGDGKVILTWDDVADTRTRDPFVGNINDFEGYKLYKATDKKLSDPLDITDGYGAPSIMKPVFQCDKIDSISGFAEFGHINGALYYLGDESGIVHHYIDTEVENGRTYYYALVAYDYGIESLKISPSENNAVIDLDEDENIRYTGQNVQIATPHQRAAGYIPPSIEMIDDDINDDIKYVTPEILAEDVLAPNHTYRVNFEIDTIALINRYDKGILYATNGYNVFDVTDNNSLVYKETAATQNGTNIQYDDTLQYYYINPAKPITSDVFDGLRLKINLPFKTAEFDPVNSVWIKGESAIKITPTINESSYFPWDYNIIFTDNPAVYTGRVTNTRGIRDENGTSRLSNLMAGESFNFYVVNTTFLDSVGSYEKLDLVAQDFNGNGQFDYLGDRIFVGPVTETGQWAGTAFIIDFLNVPDESKLPVADDVFQVTFNRPFYATDSLVFAIKPEVALDINKMKNTMENIRVVPNPYIATNAMEPAVGNIYLNQRRRIMFTNVPANCTVRIFTSSGVLVDKLDITNPADEGIVYWDLLSMEGLEVAAGMYFYHVKSTATGDEKMGKFAIIK